jgi:hypothetical protein
MKVSNLMIGDYVTVTPSGMFIQVAATHKRKVAYHACTSKLSWVREGLLRPIPLTREILEKNGMKFHTNVGWFAEDEECFLEISTKGENVYWTINDWEYSLLKINYVHELQHALKLCGIKKEIIL